MMVKKLFIEFARCGPEASCWTILRADVVLSYVIVIHITVHMHQLSVLSNWYYI